MKSNKININLKHLKTAQGLNCSILSSSSSKNEMYSDIWCDLTANCSNQSIKLSHIQSIMDSLETDGIAHITVPESFIWSKIYRPIRLELFSEMNVFEIKLNISDGVCDIAFKNNGPTTDILLKSNNCSISLNLKYDVTIRQEYIDFLKIYDNLLNLKNKNTVNHFKFNGKSPPILNEQLNLKRIGDSLDNESSAKKPKKD
jgi:hypothetical protein